MKSTTDFHREALDQALRIALGTSQPALRRQALTRAASHLIHPKLVLESPLLTDSHVWRREALLVSDAFEAVTNGMEEPGLLEALEDLEPDSPFQSWRHLILAIHFFYEGLDEAVMAHLERIPSDSPVQNLTKAMEGVIRGQVDRQAPPGRRLAELLAQPDPLIHQWVQDVAEGLEADHEPLFWSALTDWLEHVAPIAPERAKSALLWAWNQLEWRDFDEGVLLELGASLWGRTESYRLAALGTLPWDQEGAALLWIRFLLSAVREDMDRSVLAEGRQLADRFLKAAQASEPSADWSQTWANLSRAWNSEMKARGWNHWSFDAPEPSPILIPVSAGSAPDGQLDLFS